MPARWRGGALAPENKAAELVQVAVAVVDPGRARWRHDILARAQEGRHSLSVRIEREARAPLALLQRAFPLICFRPVLDSLRLLILVLVLHAARHAERRVKLRVDLRAAHKAAMTQDTKAAAAAD
jgi:hypothetical protein